MIGIDVGTIWSSAAVQIDRELRLVKEPIGQGHSFPSAVYWDAANGSLLVGQEAELARGIDPLCYAREFKRELGKGQELQLGDRLFHAEDLFAAMIGELVKRASVFASARNSEPEVVIAVPASYSDHRRGCVKEAARKANVSAELVEEPVAAALYFEHRKGARIVDGEPILIYDLGGGTFDAALMIRKAETFQLLAPPEGLDNHGGSDFDRLIFQDLCRKCSPAIRNKITDPANPDSICLRLALLDICRSVKHQLSHLKTSKVRLTHVSPSEEYCIDLHTFESLIQPILYATIDLCKRLLKSASVNRNTPFRILLNGGSSRIPLVAKLLKEKLGREPELIDDPELAVCQGAAVYGNSLKKEDVNSQRRRGPYVVRQDPFRIE